MLTEMAVFWISRRKAYAASSLDGDIVNIATDAIVNAANTELKRSPGICEATFAVADSTKLKEACRKHGHCASGYSGVTPSFGLPAHYSIHVAGPGWFGVRDGSVYFLRTVTVAL